jgi:DNA invertase Pin-like site-specific DNA recombinase
MLTPKEAAELRNELSSSAGKSGPMNTVYGYARASHVNNSTGDSIPAQEARIRERYDADFKDQFAWGGVFVDPFTSGFKLSLEKRRAGRQLLAELQRGDVLIVDKIDRLCRSFDNFSDLRRTFDGRGIRWVVVNMAGMCIDMSSALGKLVFDLWAMFAEFESRMISERIRGAIRRNIELGKKRGNLAVPPGCRRGKDRKLYWDSVRRGEMVAVVHMIDDLKMGVHAVTRVIEHCRESLGYDPTQAPRKDSGWRVHDTRPPQARPTEQNVWNLYAREKVYRLLGVTDPNRFNFAEYKRQGAIPELHDLRFDRTPYDNVIDVSQMLAYYEHALACWKNRPPHPPGARHQPPACDCCVQLQRFLPPKPDWAEPLGPRKAKKNKPGHKRRHNAEYDRKRKARYKAKRQADWLQEIARQASEGKIDG